MMCGAIEGQACSTSGRGEDANEQVKEGNVISDQSSGITTLTDWDTSINGGTHLLTSCGIKRDDALLICPHLHASLAALGWWISR